MTDEFELTVSREIAAPPEPLFDAWLDASSLSQWMRPTELRETRAETDPREGGEFRIVMVRGHEEMLHSGRYLEIDRPRRLVFTWNSAGTHGRDTVVTVTFHAREGSTLVEIHHTDLPDDDARADHADGWTTALAELDAFQR